MDGRFADLTRALDGAALLGYLNFSDGRPDPKFRKGVADVFGRLRDRGEPAAWRVAGAWLAHRAADLEAGGSAAFKDLAHAKTALRLAFDAVPAAYRRFHHDLLAHQTDETLFAPFFLARCCETVLGELSAGTPAEQVPDAVVKALNDYVGYRPIAVLETRPQTDFYPHERVAAVPLYFRGVGVAPGRYAALIEPAVNLLVGTSREVLDEAGFDPTRLDELSLDPRAIDHVHPQHKRPSTLFGEWDPHRLDGKGYYRRFVVRQSTLDALLAWAGTTDGTPPPGPPRGPLDPDRLAEAAAALAGTVLMGAGISGAGPNYHDSTVTLSKLIQRVARYRDEFYKQLLAAAPGRHGERLRQEAERRKQPFAGVRQYLNQAIAGERAVHLQERRLALLFASLGYPSAARTRAAKIPAPATRLGTEIRIRQTEAGFAAQSDGVGRVPQLLAEAEDLLKRGIECGALIDPWNILGYQGLFPIFPGREDTARDHRAEELILSVGRQFDLYSQALSAAVAGGHTGTEEHLRHAVRQLAGWWDKFATVSVSDLPRVHGTERADAAEHVARAMTLWKKGGAADPAFWRNYRDGFRTPAAFAQVIDALLQQPDYKAALALLVTWLSESDTVPLEDPAASFVKQAFRWMDLLVADDRVPSAERGPLVRRFFELLEANADDRWQVPAFGAPAGRGPDDDVDEEEEDNPYESAYEDMTYRDSTDDGHEGSVADGGPLVGEFALDGFAEEAEPRLKFLTAVARLWRTAGRPDLWPAGAIDQVAEWHRTARGHVAELRTLCDRLHAVEVADPSGGVEGVTEYDRRRAIKVRLLELAVQTAVEMTAAARSLAAVTAPVAELPGDTPPTGFTSLSSDQPAWDGIAVQLERAVATGDRPTARKMLGRFVPLFRSEPLLVHPPSYGGPPQAAVRAKVALQMVESLLARLPRLGLLRETYQLTKLARQMERNSPPERPVSSFDRLFAAGLTGVVDALLTAARDWGEDAGEDGPLAAAVRQVVESFQTMWVEHSTGLRLSALEAVIDKPDWEELKTFVRTYGGDLFTPAFLSVANMRGILGRGATAWLDLEADRDAGDTRPRLVEDWADDALDKAATARLFETVLHGLIEHYDEYRDYNSTTTQSDYGENLYILLDFLRLQVSYDRYAWRLRPVVLAHEVMCRRGFDRLAARWREIVVAQTGKLADDLLQELTQREAEHAIRVRTVRDRLTERFVQPLRVDLAASRVPRAAAAAKAGQGDGNPSFAGLLAAVQPLADHPTGVGLDVPAWLRRLEDEVRKVRSADPDPELEEEEDEPADADVPPPPAAGLDFDDLKRQLRDWNKPIGE